MSAEVHIMPGVPAPPQRAQVAYDRLCRELAEAKTLQDVKTVGDKADGVRVFARRASNRQLELDAAELRLRALRELGQRIAAMQDAGELRKPGQRTPSGGQNPPLPPRLIDLGVNKDLAKDARAMARLDMFAERLAHWREIQSTAAGKVATRLAADNLKGTRAARDFYPSPVSIIREVCRRWRPNATRVLEPCAGDGRFAEGLRAAGHQVTATDLVTGHDFFKLKTLPPGRPALATNPPFRQIRAFIDHAFAIGVTEMALIVPERLFACGDGRAQFERHRPARFAQMDWREDYLGRGGQPDRALAVAIWDEPCAGRCDYEIWSRTP